MAAAAATTVGAAAATPPMSDIDITGIKTDGLKVACIGAGELRHVGSPLPLLLPWPWFTLPSCRSYPGKRVACPRFARKAAWLWLEAHAGGVALPENLPASLRAHAAPQATLAAPPWL